MTELVDPVGGLSPEAVRYLPGARRHCAGVLADLRAGLTCVWLFPDAEVESERADRAVEEVVHGLDDVVDVPGKETGPRPAPVAAPPEPRVPWEPPGGGGGSAAHHTGDHPEDVFDFDDGFGDWDPFGILGGGGLRASEGLPPAPAVDSRFPDGPDGPGTDVAARLARSLGLDGDLVTELVGDADGRAPVLVVRAWTEADPHGVSRLLRRFQAAVKEAGLRPSDRPRLLVASRLQDLEPDTTVLLDGTVSRAHWWWGVWNHLDTATVVAEAIPHAGSGQAHDRMTPTKLIRHALRRETVVQTAGPDLGLAVELARVWSGRTGELASALGECCPGDGTVGPGSQGRSTPGAAYAPLPENGLREAWSAGSVDSWEGQIRHSPRSGAGGSGGTELDKLVWQAQNRVLLPLIDDARVGFVELLPRIAVRGVTRLVDTYVRRSLRDANGSSADPASMELGELYDAAVHRDITLTDDQFGRLRTLRLARNKLAHRTPIADALLHDLLDALSGP
ncbi:hypothetical protein [Kitasatospora sp. MY 5-36]|uniref:hypothetical protein n=1 Tax=Kitasatospora sp. MY 5-36 TaxID=1678027 RepID=UPI0006715D30|nr:hypothetical protein [Kitasatospora sp. MY 5-36]